MKLGAFCFRDFLWEFFRNSFRIPAVCGLFYFFAPGLLLADTEGEGTAPSIQSAFDSTTVKITTMPNEVGVPVEWKYSNLWDFPLVVEKFEQSCGCLSGLPESKIKIIESGERGIIRASFTPGANRGLLRKSLHVRFVSHEKPVELVIEATIPSSVELSARELDWISGEKPATQSIEVTSGTGADFSITSLPGVSKKQFSITEETLVAQRHYRLHITPVDVSTPGVLCLQVRTNSADSRDQVLPVFLRISPPAIGTEVPAL